jgi:hypothetical protein
MSQADHVARSPNLLKEVFNVPRSAWRDAELGVPTCKYRFPKVYEQTVAIEKRQFRQLFIKDLGHSPAFAPPVIAYQDITGSDRRGTGWCPRCRR